MVPSDPWAARPTGAVVEGLRASLHRVRRSRGGRIGWACPIRSLEGHPRVEVWRREASLLQQQRAAEESQWLSVARSRVPRERSSMETGAIQAPLGAWEHWCMVGMVRGGSKGGGMGNFWAWRTRGDPTRAADFLFFRKLVNKGALKGAFVGCSPYFFEPFSENNGILRSYGKKMLRLPIDLQASVYGGSRKMSRLGGPKTGVV